MSAIAVTAMIVLAVAGYIVGLLRARSSLAAEHQLAAGELGRLREALDASEARAAAAEQANQSARGELVTSNATITELRAQLEQPRVGRSEPRAEPWPEPRAAPRAEPWPEPRAEPSNPGIRGTIFDQPARIEPAKSEPLDIWGAPRPKRTSSDVFGAGRAAAPDVSAPVDDRRAAGVRTSASAAPAAAAAVNVPRTPTPQVMASIVSQPIATAHPSARKPYTIKRIEGEAATRILQALKSDASLMRTHREAFIAILAKYTKLDDWDKIADKPQTPGAFLHVIKSDPALNRGQREALLMVYNRFTKKSEILIH